MLQLHGPVQEIPMYEARIVLHKTRRDAFGIPMLSSQGGKHPLTAVQAKIMTDAAESVLREAGAKTVWKVGDKPNLSYCNAGGQHQAGSCRMGDNPKYSVVDPDCKVWGTETYLSATPPCTSTTAGLTPS